MTKKVFTIFAVLCFNIALAQASGDGDNNQKDANNMKQGHWIVYNQDGKFPGYDDGMKVEEGDYLNNKKVGVWTKYYPNGNKEHEITFANNVANGYAKFYYKDGTIQEEGMWQNNKWVGQYKYYHENGQVFYSWNYNSSGKREGHQEYYYENGNKMIEGDWANGNEQGVLKEYYEEGSLKDEKTFNNGKIDPAATKNYPVGKIYPPGFKKPEVKVTVIAKTEENTEAKQDSASVAVVQEKAEQAKPLGFLEDGFHTTYNAKGKKLKEGTFVSGHLIDGKEFFYNDKGELAKTVVVKDGTRTEELVKK